MDCLIASFILGVGGVSLWMLVPTVNHGKILATHQAKASEMATRMAEQLQSLSASGVNGANLKSLQLIDSDSPVTGTLNFSNVPLDEATQYSPSTALPTGTGSLTLSTLSNGAVMATITIGWQESQSALTYQTATIVGAYR